MRSNLPRFVAGALVVFSITVAPAAATPITVNLRVEGSTSTLFEGPIGTDAATFSTPSSPAAHPCDYAHNGPYPPGGPAGATPATALRDAARSTGLAFDASWSTSYNDFLISRVGDDANGSAPLYPSWGYALEYTTAQVGACQLKLAPNNTVLWAYDFFNKSHLLALSGPGAANVGQPIVLTVLDGQNGSPIAGATVGSVATDASGNPTTTYAAATDAQGHATVTFPTGGVRALKAFHNTDSIRSNRLDVCVHNGNDGTCGTTVPTASPPPPAPPLPPGPVARILGLSDGLRLARGPRVLRGLVEGSAPLREVDLRLVRIRGHHHCAFFSVRRGRFVGAKCAAGSNFLFSVGTARQLSYLLPARLRRGRYVLDLEAVDINNKRDQKPEVGRNRVRFTVV